MSKRPPCMYRGCARQAYRNGLCRLHLEEPLAIKGLRPADYKAFEEITAAAHDFLWELEMRARRRRRGLLIKSPQAARLRAAVRNAQDVLLP